MYNEVGDKMQRYFAREKHETTFRLNEDDLYHITVVMRMKPGDEIEVVYNQSVYLCCIENVNKEVVVRMKKEYQQEKERIPHVIFCIPFLKEQKMDYILQKATELGVSEIVPTVLNRSIIKLDDAKFQKKKVRWQKICKEASEQSMRNMIPVIRDRMTLSEVALLDGVMIVCSTRKKEKSLKKLLQTVGDCDTLVIVVGPEGGLEEEEEKFLVDAGFSSVTLGNRILRVETVPLYVLSAINYNYME